MPARVLDDPLGIACVFSDGRRVRRLLGEVAGPQLARDLMSGLAQLVHPPGIWSRRWPGAGSPAGRAS
jgi:hypothetical protein